MRPTADVTMGYAVNPSGHGMAYASSEWSTARHTCVRLPFTIEGSFDERVRDRATGYAAIATLAAYLRSRGYTRLRLSIADERLVEELTHRATVPSALALSHVTVTGALRSFAFVRIVTAQPIDTHNLTARARADVALNAPSTAATA